jgi:hypothetical protein
MNAPERITPIAHAAMGATTTHDPDFERLLHNNYSPRAMLEGDSMDKMLNMAEQMARSKISVPEHLRGNVGDCMAIVTQAMLWDMNPFAVAQKTHIVSGRLGYEAQLVNAVVQNSGAVRGAPRYEYRGEGSTMECRAGFVLRGESEITWGEWLNIKDVTTKNSPLWKTNPKQQMGYLQVKNWARAFCPGAILGVYSVDELEEQPAMPTGRPQIPLRAVPPAAAPVSDFAALLRDAQGEADKGSEAFRAWWKAATREQRAALKPHMADFEQRAAQADTPPPQTDPETGEISNDDATDPWLQDLDAAEGRAHA